MTQFTAAKTKVRELNLKALQECLRVSTPSGKLAYFGLPSPELEDVIVWQPFLSRVDAVERGCEGREYRSQHRLVANAMLKGVPGFTLLRGDIDDIVCNGEDAVGCRPRWPFDIVNLDYTGGLLYKQGNERAKRMEAIKKLVEAQGQQHHSFFLCVTVNDRHHDAGEVAATLDDMAADSLKDGVDLSKQVASLKSDPDARLAVYVYLTHVLLALGRQWFRIGPYRPILYTGTRDYRMLNAAFCFKATGGSSAPARLGVTARQLLEKQPIVIEDEVGDREQANEDEGGDS